jgi:predicted ABC-type transport system involved in lysophospholipase L1 biosynthesis ATPase subunit
VQRERAMTLLLITHEPELARRCARRLEMADGRLHEPATARHRVALATDEVA